MKPIQLWDNSTIFHMYRGCTHIKLKAVIIRAEDVMNIKDSLLLRSCYCFILAVSYTDY